MIAEAADRVMAQVGQRGGNWHDMLAAVRSAGFDYAVKGVGADASVFDVGYLLFEDGSVFDPSDEAIYPSEEEFVEAHTP